MRRTCALILIFGAAMALLFGCEPPPAPPTSPPDTTPPAQVQSTSPPENKPVTNIPESLRKHPDRLHALENLGSVDLKANSHTIHAWVMDDDGERQEGMMYLDAEDVPNDRGMLFVFPEERPGDAMNSFWMHNTPLALDIIYIGKDKKVVNVGAGKPMSDAQVVPEGPYQYVLELKAGTAKSLGIQKGTLVEIPASVKTEH